MSERGVWVVEMRLSGAWHATVGIGLTREDARRACREWRMRNPQDSFRIRRYIPESEADR